MTVIVKIGGDGRRVKKAKSGRLAGRCIKRDQFAQPFPQRAAGFETAGNEPRGDHGQESSAGCNGSPVRAELRTNLDASLERKNRYEGSKPRFYAFSNPPITLVV